MAIRVTDAKGNTSTKTFKITFTQAATPIQLNSISDIQTLITCTGLDEFIKRSNDLMLMIL